MQYHTPCAKRETKRANHKARWIDSGREGVPAVPDQCLYALRADHWHGCLVRPPIRLCSGQAWWSEEWDGQESIDTIDIDRFAAVLAQPLLSAQFSPGVAMSLNAMTMLSGLQVPPYFATAHCCAWAPVKWLRGRQWTK